MNTPRLTDDAGSAKLGDTLRPNTTFEAVWQRDAFDRHLRLLAMDTVERIEVAVRTRLSYSLAHQSGDPFAYSTDPGRIKEIGDTSAEWRPPVILSAAKDL